MADHAGAPDQQVNPAIQAAQTALANIENGAAIIQNGAQALAVQLPALFPAVALQNMEIRLNQQHQDVMNTLNRIEDRVNRIDARVNQIDARVNRIDARVSNGAYDHSVDYSVMWPPALQDTLPLPAPTAGTWAAVQDLEVGDLRPYMVAYGLSVQGNQKTQLKRLQRYLGLRLAVPNLNA